MLLVVILVHALSSVGVLLIVLSLLVAGHTLGTCCTRHHRHLRETGHHHGTRSTCISHNLLLVVRVHSGHLCRIHRHLLVHRGHKHLLRHKSWRLLLHVAMLLLLSDRHTTLVAVTTSWRSALVLLAHIVFLVALT